MKITLTTKGNRFRFEKVTGVFFYDKELIIQCGNTTNVFKNAECAVIDMHVEFITDKPKELKGEVAEG
jgi:hypothetical protein